MSEEILKALMELFALISKQDDGTSNEERAYVELFLKQQLSEKNAKIYLHLFDTHAGLVGEQKVKQAGKKKRISMLDSVKTIGVCEKITSTLQQKQKVIVLARLLELLKAQKDFTDQKKELIYTAAEVFKIDLKKVNFLLNFIKEDNQLLLDNPDVVIITNDEETQTKNKKVVHEGIKGVLAIYKIEEDLYFLIYNGYSSEILLNGLTIIPGNVYVFSNGSSLKSNKGKPIYYSDIVSILMEASLPFRLSLEASHMQYKFKNGGIGLRDINILENEGKLVGIMGASGAGKTTLLNALMGSFKISKGFVKINGIDVHKDKDKLRGVIGYVPQDDLLMEDLSVFQNLYYCAKLCFNNLSEKEIEDLVDKTLLSLGLIEIKNLKVGTPLNKTISGGQRKRLNIALELIREPSVIFLDEPTSGLSSRDSENVMDLLKELCLKGKLVFVVIHQPSSDIYKMFDKIVILDVGGYQIYYENPVEAISYFKRLDRQINSEISECPNCGTVNPESIFNIIEARVVDEYGSLTDERKVTPVQWRKHYEEHSSAENAKISEDVIPQNLFIPLRFKQFKIFTVRDFISKINNLQYILINILEAPLLGFFLSFIIKYIDDPNSDHYIFRENENIPSYIFMGIIVSLFIGLTVSAEEIFRDRKILKRESFLNLSRHSYLMSKLAILFVLSAIQSGLFVLIGNVILEIQGMLLYYWLMFFSVFCLSNVLGLNISSAFNSAVTIYIVIPLLIIPQMILGGAMFPFEKLNKMIGGGYSVPIFAEMMPSRWAYEGLMVQQFRKNEYTQNFYDIDQKISVSDFKYNYLLPDLTKRLNFCKVNLFNKQDSTFQILKSNLAIIHNEIEKERLSTPHIRFENVDKINTQEVEVNLFSDIQLYLDLITAYYEKMYNSYSNKKEKFLITAESKSSDKQKLNELRDRAYNERIAELVRKSYSKHTLININNHIIQITDPIYNFPVYQKNVRFDYPLFTPFKYLANIKLDTFWYNICAIWFYSFILYIFLYYEIFYKLIKIFSFNN